MEFKGIEICCPHCRGALEEETHGESSSLRCCSCEHAYPIMLDNAGFMNVGMTLPDVPAGQQSHFGSGMQELIGPVSPAQATPRQPPALAQDGSVVPCRSRQTERMITRFYQSCV